MRVQSTDTCAGCSKFELAHAAANQGIAQCPEFESNMHYKDRACVLHLPAKDRERRKQLVVQLMQNDNTRKGE